MSERDSTFYPVVESGVDWLTAVAVTPQSRSKLYRLSHDLTRLLASQGFIQKPIGYRSYKGWQIGGLRALERETDSMIDLSGQAAFLHWRGPLAIGCRPSRIDLQVTISEVEDERDLASDGYGAIERFRAGSEEHRVYSRITTKPHGATLYIGAPSSAVRCRLYDKSAESKGLYPPGTWRYECQARAGVARALAAGLDLRRQPGRAIAGYVYQRFATSGVEPRYRRGSQSVYGAVPRTRSDAARRLRWLQDQVRPALKWLQAHHPEIDVYAPLGLKGPLEP